MRLEQGKTSQKRYAKEEAPVNFDAPADYPSTRYFQIHFQHLYELVESLKNQVAESNRQIAAQHEILRNLLQKTDAQPCPACLRVATPKPPRKRAPTVQEQAPPYHPG
jgi:hypothetical protein